MQCKSEIDKHCKYSIFRLTVVSLDSWQCKLFLYPLCLRYLVIDYGRATRLVNVRRKLVDSRLSKTQWDLWPVEWALLVVVAVLACNYIALHHILGHLNAVRKTCSAMECVLILRWSQQTRPTLWNDNTKETADETGVYLPLLSALTRRPTP